MDFMDFEHVKTFLAEETIISNLIAVSTQSGRTAGRLDALSQNPYGTSIRQIRHAVRHLNPANLSPFWTTFHREYALGWDHGKAELEACRTRPDRLYPQGV